MSRIDQQPYVKNDHLTIFCAIDMYMFLISQFSIYHPFHNACTSNILSIQCNNNNKRNQQILYANFAKNMLSFITDKVFNKNVGIVTVPFIHKFPPSQYLSNNDTEKHNPISHTKLFSLYRIDKFCQQSSTTERRKKPTEVNKILQNAINGGTNQSIQPTRNHKVCVCFSM